MKQIDEYINREKRTKPTPFLEGRIMAAIDSQIAQRKSIGFMRTALVAASLVAVVTLGVTIGNTFSVAEKEYDALVINDSHIENFTILTSDEE